MFSAYVHLVRTAHRSMASTPAIPLFASRRTFAGVGDAIPINYKKVPLALESILSPVVAKHISLLFYYDDDICFAICLHSVPSLSSVVRRWRWRCCYRAVRIR